MSRAMTFEEFENEILNYKRKWYEYPEYWWYQLGLKIESIKCYFKNCWRFRRILKEYEGFDFSYDLDMLLIMYDIKEKSFEIGKEFVVEGAKDLEKIREIKAQIQKVINLECELDAAYIKEYQRLFQLLKQSYKFWW